jgi:hypothetical protein
VSKSPFFPTSLPEFVVCFFDDGYFDSCEIEFLFHFYFHFPLLLRMLNNVFICLLSICTSFESYLFYSFAHLLIGFFILLVFNFLELFQEKHTEYLQAKQNLSKVESPIARQLSLHGEINTHGCTRCPLRVLTNSLWQMPYHGRCMEPSNHQ